MQITEEIRDLFDVVRIKLGNPIRQVEIDDNTMCGLLSIAVGDYAEKVQNWIIQANWMNMKGQNIKFLQDPMELAYSFTTRQLDFTRDFTYWFSREVGLQQRGVYELKKDLIQIEKGKQCYLIPAGREVNKVMYVTPPTTKAALYGNLGTLDTGIGMGIGQYGNMGNGMGLQGFYIGSAYDTALLSVDLKFKNSLLKGDLCYKITAGPDGTHILHLLSTPGSPNVFGNLAIDDTWGSKYNGYYVWYTYYDTLGLDDDGIDACRMENKDSILITPDQVPLSKMRYEFMNEPTKNTIRRLLYAECLSYLAKVRGYASGKISIFDSEMQLDYSMLKEEAQKEKDDVFNELKERLESMLPWNMLKNQADMTDSLVNILKHKPLGFYVK